jgi:dihydrodipicolinate synthase/N-acetylneuraminate lyase
VPVTPGVGETCPEKVIPLCRYAKEAGADAVVMCSPYYYKLDQDMVRRHFEVVADAVDIPIVLYNIPMFTNPIAVDTVTALMRHPNIVGIKDSSGDAVYWMQVLGYAREIRPDFALMIGREESFYASLCAGASGAMVGIAGILPELTSALYDRFMAGDLEGAKKLQYIMLPVLRTLTAGPFPVCLKAGVEVRGLDCGCFKQPLTAEAEARYRASFPGVSVAVGKALGQMNEVLGR